MHSTDKLSQHAYDSVEFHLVAVFLIVWGTSGFSQRAFMNFLFLSFQGLPVFFHCAYSLISGFCLFIHGCSVLVHLVLFVLSIYAILLFKLFVFFAISSHMYCFDDIGVY